MKTLAQRSDPHLARRLWHFGGVITMFFLEWKLSHEQALKVALYVSGFLITLDLLRLRYAKLNQLLIPIFKPFLREHEKDRPTGSTFMLLGVTLIVYFFPKPVVLLTLLFFSVADPIAGYIGTLYGKDKLIGPKSLQGSLAAFAACFVLTVIYCAVFHTMNERLIMAAVVCGLIGSISELLPIAGLDDNFIFPILCASLLTPALLLFGGL